MGSGGKEDWWRFIQSWAFLWDGDVRWSVGLYISPSRRERDSWQHTEKMQGCTGCKEVARSCAHERKHFLLDEHAFKKAMIPL